MCCPSDQGQVIITNRTEQPPMPMKTPPHPGQFIRTEIVEPAGLCVSAAAGILHVSRPRLSSLLNGKADLSGEMALRIEKAFGVEMDTLVRMQSNYDLTKTRSREEINGIRRFRPADARPQRCPRRAHLMSFRDSSHTPDSSSYPLRSAPVSSPSRYWRIPCSEYPESRGSAADSG
jgi:addiction module HigA family antidote